MTIRDLKSYDFFDVKLQVSTVYQSCMDKLEPF